MSSISLAFGLLLLSGGLTAVEACLRMNKPAMGAPIGTCNCLHYGVPVSMADGKSLMKAGDLSIGDLVWDGVDATPVIWVPVLDNETRVDFVEFTTENGLGSSVTPDHLVFAGQCGRGLWPIKRADNLTIGECVPTANGGEDRITDITHPTLTGRILPITKSGKIEAGGVTLSCYNSEYEGITQDEKHSRAESIRQFYDLGEKIYDSYGDTILSYVIESLGLDKLYK